MPGFGSNSFEEPDSPEDKLLQEAEEFMRQGRYNDAVSRYSNLRGMAPTDPWAYLGCVSAMECAGDVGEAEQLLEEAAHFHGSNIHVQRFRRMFFERREDYRRAIQVREALSASMSLQEEPVDQLADLYFNQGRYHEAQSELQRVLDEEIIDDDQTKASVRARIGACLRQDGQLEPARDHLLAALTLDPANHWTLTELAEAERALGNADAARARYHQALEANPQDHWCRGHLAQLEHEQGNGDVAVQLYEAILQQHPAATWALVELAQVIGDSDSERSRELCEQALQEDPTYPWAYAQLGQLARASGNYSAARNHFQQALSASPNSTWVLHELADSCRLLGRVEEALTHLEHARNQNPYEATTYGYMADILRSDGQAKAAKAHLAKAVELDPTYVWAWREMAEIDALAGDYASAENAHQEATRLEPEEAINDGLMAFILRCKGDRGAAIPFLRSAVKRQPDYAWAWRELSEQLLAENNAAEALNEIEQGLQHLPQHGPLMLLHAEAQRRLGRLDTARQTIAEATDAEPNVPQLWAMRAELTLEHDASEALRYARRAARLDQAGDFQILLAQVLVANERHDEAKRIAKKLSNDQPQLASAWVLLCYLDERAGTPRNAEAAARQGIEHCPDDQRLILRLARLEWRREASPGLTRLDRFFDGRTDGPWRDLAQLLAQGKRTIQCRMALNRCVEAAHGSESATADAWMLWAECEVALGEPAAAKHALNKALDANPQLPAARMLAAALEENGDHPETAIQHLETLRHDYGNRLSDLADNEVSYVLKNLAHLYHKVGRKDDATTTWMDVLSRPIDDQTRVEASRFFTQNGDVNQSALIINEGLESRDENELGSEGSQTLIHEACLLHWHEGGNVAARDYLTQHQAHLSIENRELLTQLALASGDATLAAEQAEMVQAHGNAAAKLRAQVLSIRIALAQADVERALKMCQAILHGHPANEEAATLYAECLAYRRELPKALEIVRSSALPKAANLERGLLTAMLLLETRGSEPALAWLARCRALWDTEQHIDIPLIRLLNAAFPDTWLEEAVVAAAGANDISSLPPFPRAAECISAALAAQGHGLLAAQCSENVAHACHNHGQKLSARILYMQASRHYRLIGQRPDSRRCARSGGSLWLWLRGLIG